MAGTALGAKKARDRNLAKDPNFYKKIGFKGGKKSRGGGFASLKVGKDGLTGPERAKLANAKQNQISERQIERDWDEYNEER